MCLNEAVDSSGKLVFKPWDERLDREKFVDSDVDEELLFNIPFTGHIKLKGIIVIGGGEGMDPSKMKLYKNRPSMTFDDVSTEPDQEFDLNPDPDGQLEYPTKVARFNQVEHLTIFFSTNFGAENTRIHYIGLRGEFTEMRRHGVTICNYEAQANPMDHKSNLLNKMGHVIQ
ncbi:PITH domain-containing protein GA19395,PITH domain-containing protein CG6153,PITH domain-containing protein ZK353.9,PITH domain-containing protein 1 [Acanthosepion pharaonis]|uniref:PITH domain-containing protein GA19395,PITH domain-containing protein CG6153,PITH domain-containing protein ZK353.9,PITH domain-containing protein 1 n=1 Tax=Acanthosepion pharaonis TaxID=158019 RepID=A0A812CP85_ACAPH|nr:PITH domain-containing protein GA19395,PITH domain-containing protein CG6153,PITH domain-containing protein ZK353.9,PITH domain-containing protein 1 [Sepia pharaonis]